MKKKRTTTRWLYHGIYKGGTYIKVGRVYNQREVPADIIRWKIESASPGGSMDFACTVDEAVAMAAGLMGVLASEMLPKSDRLRKMFR